MDQLIKESIDTAHVINPISSAELVLALVTSAILNLFIAKTYIATHSGYSYSKSYVHALVFVGITVALIMVIIGSNIARAFALVGAMSIVRFRNPVKDSRDLVFVFMAIAIGMACGTRFYLFGAVFAIFSVALLLAMHHWGFGELQSKGYVLKVRAKAEDRGALTAICEDLCHQFSIISIDRSSDADGFEDVIYEIELRRSTSYDDFVNKLTETVRSASISLLVGESDVSA